MTSPHCNCHFYSCTETLALNDRGAVQVSVPELISSTTLKEEDNTTLTLEETWATSDYLFKANNSVLTQYRGGLYTALKARAEGNKADWVASPVNRTFRLSVSRGTARIWTSSAVFEPCFVDSDVDTDERSVLEPY